MMVGSFKALASCSSLRNIVWALLFRPKIAINGL